MLAKGPRLWPKGFRKKACVVLSAAIIHAGGGGGVMLTGVGMCWGMEKHASDINAVGLPMVPSTCVWVWYV